MSKGPNLSVDDIDRIVSALAGNAADTLDELEARLQLAIRFRKELQWREDASHDIAVADELKQRRHQSPPPHVAVEPKAPLTQDERMELIRERARNIA